VGRKTSTWTGETLLVSTLGIVPEGPMPLPPKEGEKTGRSTRTPFLLPPPDGIREGLLALPPPEGVPATEEPGRVGLKASTSDRGDGFGFHPRHRP